MKRRVLVLGGGCGGVATAWALTRTAELRDRFDVTLIQAGWRLGGKGATGRDPARGHGVLEHGLHLWLGFYRQAFGMIADIYRHHDGPRVGPQSSIEAAFSPMRDVALVDGADGGVWRMRFPETAGTPWEPHAALDRVRTAAAWVRNLRDALVEDPLDPWTTDRYATLAGLATTVARGLASEMARHRGDPWLAMDEVDLRAWLRAHGATARQASSPPIGALYDLGFAYPDLTPTHDGGSAAAGVALRVLLNVFGGYRGAPFWRMNAGMGDTVFAPAYEVLKARGVRFRWFRRVSNLGLDAGGIDAVELAVQATGAEGYRPLIEVGDVRAWPNEPLRTQLGEVASGDMEADTGAELGRETLRRGRDFDDVVLAIPATGHHHMAAELIETNDRFAEMVANTHGVPTIAAQCWLARRAAQLGWRGVPSVATGADGLFRTWADLSEVLDAEGWRDRPASLAYFCSVAPREVAQISDRHEASRWVRAHMREWAATDLARLWPESRRGARFDEAALAKAPGKTGWDTQYARANVADWERYILSLPGTTKHRLAPDQSGFDNLFLAGDWTANVVNGGSVEGAVSSGVAAARAMIAGEAARRARAPGRRTGGRSVGRP